MLNIKNLFAYVRCLDVKCHTLLITAMLQALLKLMERLLAVTGLASACAGHAAHPVQLASIQVKVALTL